MHVAGLLYNFAHAVFTALEDLQSLIFTLEIFVAEAAYTAAREINFAESIFTEWILAWVNWLQHLKVVHSCTWAKVWIFCW